MLVININTQLNAFLSESLSLLLTYLLTNCRVCDVEAMTSTPVDMVNVTVTTSLWDNYTDHEYLHPACGIFDFVIEVVLMGLLCAFGFVGNSLSTVCLLRDESKSATPFLLVSLQIADTLFLIAVVWVRVITSVEESFREQAAFIASLTPYIGRYVFPCAMIAETGWLLSLHLLCSS